MTAAFVRYTKLRMIESGMCLKTQDVLNLSASAICKTEKGKRVSIIKSIFSFIINEDHIATTNCILQKLV